MENPMGNRRQGATPLNLHHVLLGSRAESKTSKSQGWRLQGCGSLGILGDNLPIDTHVI